MVRNPLQGEIYGLLLVLHFKTLRHIPRLVKTIYATQAYQALSL